MHAPTPPNAVPDPGVAGTILDALRLLWTQARHWLPIVAVLAMVAALPEAILEHYMPDASSLMGSLLTADPELIFAGLATVLLLLATKLVVELVALMFAFVILADLSAGRTPDTWDGLRRLASWKLQFAWLVAGIFEQTAISMWFLGGTLLLLPVGLATTVAYEEDNGFQSFPRALKLGLMEMGPARPGIRIAVAVTAGFFVGFVISTLVSLVSCATTAAAEGPGLFDLYNALQGGAMPTELPAAASSSSWLGPALGVLLSPLAMLPTVFMITVQQMTYWQARRFEEAQGAAG